MSKVDEFFLPRSGEELEGYVSKYGLTNNAQAMKALFFDLKLNLQSEKENSKRTIDKGKENLIAIISILAIFFTSYPSYISNNNSLGLSYSSDTLLCCSIIIFFILSFLSLFLNTKTYIATTIGKHPIDGILKLYQHISSNPSEEKNQKLEIENYGELDSVYILYLCKLVLAEFNSIYNVNIKRKKISNIANILTVITFIVMLLIYILSFIRFTGE